jgi:hypothetical protein
MCEIESRSRMASAMGPSHVAHQETASDCCNCRNIRSERRFQAIRAWPLPLRSATTSPLRPTDPRGLPEGKSTSPEPGPPRFLSTRTSGDGAGVSGVTRLSMGRGPASFSRTSPQTAGHSHQTCPLSDFPQERHRSSGQTRRSVRQTESGFNDSPQAWNRRPDLGTADSSPDLS